MRQKIKKAFPNICIGFTILTLLRSISHIIIQTRGHIQHGGGIRVSTFSLFTLGIFCCLFLGNLVSILLEKLHFKHRITYFLLELSADYLLYLGCVFLFRWTHFTWKELLLNICITTFLYLNFYFLPNQKKCKKEADGINRLIKLRKQEHKKGEV